MHTPKAIFLVKLIIASVVAALVLSACGRQDATVPGSSNTGISSPETPAESRVVAGGDWLVPSTVGIGGCCTAR